MGLGIQLMKAINQLIEHQTVVYIDGNFQLSFGGNVVAMPFVFHVKTGTQSHQQQTNENQS
jgi:hypothetical protein